jgi:hypothetical protein
MYGFDKTITIYTQHYDAGTRKTSWPKTVIEGASWSGYRKVQVVAGLSPNDKYSVRIPKDNVPEGLTVKNGDVVILGTGPDVINGIDEITSQYDPCFTVTAVHPANLDWLLPHLRLEGE